MSAILFGSLSTLVDTSELQRRSFNEAFARHELDWNWSQEEYRSLLDSNGGAGRIADYAAGRGSQVDAAAVHATKSNVFLQLLAEESVSARPGVAEVIAAAAGNGTQLGFVTTTSRDNIDAVLSALAPEVSADSFAVIVDASQVTSRKPDPEAYGFALAALGETAADCVAIEDNAGGVRSAVAAGIDCVAFPNQNTAGADFDGAVETVDSLDPDRVHALIASR